MRQSGRRVLVIGLIILAIGLVAALTGANSTYIWIMGGVLTALAAFMLIFARWLSTQADALGERPADP